MYKLILLFCVFITGCGAFPLGSTTKITPATVEASRVVHNTTEPNTSTKRTIIKILPPGSVFSPAVEQPVEPKNKGDKK